MSLFTTVYSAGLTLWALGACLKRDRRVCQQKLSPLELPPIRPGSIWVHAVSLGETRAIIPLIRALQQQWTDRDWIISTSTQTGLEEAKRALPEAKAHLYLPIDWKCHMDRLMAQAKPSHILLSESDIWYHFLQAAHHHGAQVTLINGKISERSFRRHRAFPSLSRRLLSNIDHFCLQVPLYAERFQQLGIPSSRITITGNIKWDATYPTLSPTERTQLSQRLGLTPDQPTLIVGSTHHPEEELILNALPPLIKTIIVPRHPDRFETVARLIQSKGFRLGRYSQGAQPSDQVVLLDTTGLLRTAYQLADLAIVAGSFTATVGGHNILEPLGYGVPVLFGPHLHSQPGLAELVLSANAGVQVTPTTLAPTLASLLANPATRHTLGQNGLALIQSNQGSISRTLSALGINPSHA